jgi:hypothetical protein
VLVLSGSGRGLTTSYAAAVLAAHGYPSLALAYFTVPGLPKTLHNIPLGYFAKALGCCGPSPAWIPRHVLVSGVSRGGEAALLLGASFPRRSTGSSPAFPARWPTRRPCPRAGRPGPCAVSQQACASGRSWS